MTYYLSPKNPVIRNTSPENQQSTCLSFVITDTFELKVSIFRKQFRGIQEANPALLNQVIWEFHNSYFRFSQNVADLPCRCDSSSSLWGFFQAAFSSAPSEDGTRHCFPSPQERLSGLTSQPCRLGFHSPLWLQLLFLPDLTASCHRIGNLGAQTHLPVQASGSPVLYPCTSKNDPREEKVPTFLSKAWSIINSNGGDFRKRNVTTQRNHSTYFIFFKN